MLAAFLAALAALGGFAFRLLYLLPGDHTFGLWLVGVLTGLVVVYLIWEIWDALRTSPVTDWQRPLYVSPTTTVCGSLDRRGPDRPDTWSPLFPS